MRCEDVAVLEISIIVKMVKIVMCVCLEYRWTLTGLFLGVRRGLVYHPPQTNPTSCPRVRVRYLFDLMPINAVQQPRNLHLFSLPTIVRSQRRETMGWTHPCTEVHRRNVADQDLLRDRDLASPTTYITICEAIGSSSNRPN